MLYINKKKICFFSLILLMFTITSFYLILIEDETIETVSLPISNKTIVLDAGHGSPDEGAFLLHKENKQLTFYK